MTNEITTTAIAANIAALTARLQEAASLATEANAAMQDGQTNEAIGTLLMFERHLREADALFHAALTLHRAE